MGENHSGAITEDGSLYMWGNNSEGQVGDRTTKNNPVPTKVLENVSSVSLTDYQSGAITEDGSLYMWGSRIYQRWDGNMASTASSIPEKELNNVKSVSLGLASYYYGAIVEDGSLYMWGEGYVGDGTTEMREVPTKVLDNVRSMSLGSGFSGAITEDGSLYMWGRNRYGQLGDGTTENKLVPTRIPFPPESTTYNSPAKNSGFKILNPVFSAKREREEQAMPSASKTFTDLKPEATYNFYIMESKEAEDKFSSENLLYIKQAKADSEGVLRMEYPSNVSVSDAEAFVVCAKQDNIANAQITAKTASYNGKEQFADVTVIYNGKTLEEGKDYEIEGSFSATEAGTYSVTVTGIGVYTGEKTIDWEIKQTGQIENKLGDVNKDGKINSEDALAVLKYDVRIAQEIFVEEAADVNKDGKVNSEDALDILKHDVKLLQIS